MEELSKKIGEKLQKIIDDAKIEVESIKSTEVDNTDFVTPINPLDPVVVFDPEIEFPNIVLPYPVSSEFENIPDPNTNINNNTNMFNIEGIKIPLVKLNNKVLMANNIRFMDISLNNILPEIHLEVYDVNGNIQATDVPGMNNDICVIMIAPIDGANKKIVLDFYIEECKFGTDGSITYDGKLKLNSLRQKQYTQLGNKELTTYEFLEQIAKNTKLGFAVSKNCKEIDDKCWRLLHSQNYIDIMESDMQHAGVDKDSIFEYWIDCFGYIVLVNLSTIMKEKIDPKQLTTKVIKGTPTDIPLNHTPQQEVEEVSRVLLNSREAGTITNLYFESYRSEVNNSDIVNNGSNNKYYYLTSPCDENIIEEQEIQIVENSVDGINGTDEYTFTNVEFYGTIQDEEGVAKIKQEKEINNFKSKLYSKSLVIEMPVANYSLERGMLVNVLVNEYEGKNKRIILSNAANTQTLDEDESTESPELSKEDVESVIDENNGVMNPSLSGIYYIAGIDYIYYAGSERIREKMKLIKKGFLNNITNKYTEVKS